MAKRMIIMFSMLFASLAILLSSDLVASEMIYGELENISITVGYYISRDGGISETIRTYVKKEINGSIYCAMEECSAIKKGDTYFYVIEKSYTPIIFHKNDNNIRVKKSVVIGLYN